MNDSLTILLMAVIILILTALLYKTLNKEKKDAGPPDVSCVLPKTHTDSISAPPVEPSKILIIPPNDKIAIDESGLPYVKDRVYESGWGHRFNVFVTKSGKCYHNRKCPTLNHKTVSAMHLYMAICDDKLEPCPVCKPKTKIDDWYLKQLPGQNQPEQLTMENIK